MKTILFVAVIMFIQSGLSTYDSSYLKSNESAVASMYEVANGVLTDLKQAKGILPLEPPHLNVRQFTGSQKLAIMYLDKGEIHLDELTYRICRGMGKDSLNALAFILGHELGHFIHKHGSVNHNIEQVSPGIMEAASVRAVVDELDSIPELSDFKDRLSTVINNYTDTGEEAEADFEGAFLGFLAGYETMDAGGEFFTRAYNHPFMGLSSRASGYPTKEQRLEIIAKTGADLSTLTTFFEMANYLMAIEQYEDAIPYLEKILTRFESREIYNNIGVMYLMETLRLFEYPVTKYKLPLTLDVTFRVPHPQYYGEVTSGTEESTLFPLASVKDFCQLSFAQEQIQKAEAYFEKAIFLDNDYVFGYLNLSIAQLLKAQLFHKTQCSTYKTEEFSKALGNASIARKLVEKSLDGVAVEYFDLPDSDTINCVSIPANRELVPLPTMMQMQIDSIPDSTGQMIEVVMTREIKSIYPYRKDIFNREQWLVGSGNPKIASETRWFTPDGQIPDRAVLFSNVCMLIDVIRILNGELNQGKLTYPSQDELGDYLIEPFTRALEIHPSNQLALTNRQLSLTGSSPIESVDSIRNCKQIDLFSGRPLNEWGFDEIVWGYAETIRKSKLIAEFKSGGAIDDGDVETLRRGYTRLEQTIKFKHARSHFIYVNKSEMPKSSGRLEESYFVVPRDFTEMTTACGIGIGDVAEVVKSKYGAPTNSVGISNGHLLVYEISAVVNRSDTEVAENPDDDIPVWDGTGPAPVSFIQQYNDGIIFKLNTRDEVTGWVLYHRMIRTEAAVASR